MSIIEKIENAMANENKEELEKLLKIWDLGVDNQSTPWYNNIKDKEKEVIKMNFLISVLIGMLLLIGVLFLAIYC